MHPTISAVPIHTQEADAQSSLRSQASRAHDPSPPVRLGLSPADQAAALTFTKAQFPPTTASEVVEQARALAEALAGPDGTSSRQRTIARRIAVAKTQAEHLDVLLGQAVARKDFLAARELNRLLNSATTRLCALLEQLARQGSSRAVVVSANTTNILVR